MTDPVYPYMIRTAILLKWHDKPEWEVLKLVGPDDAAKELWRLQMDSACSSLETKSDLKLGKARVYPDGHKEVEDGDVP